jgi:hypothetical protein
MTVLATVLLMTAVVEIPSIQMPTPPDFTISVNDGQVPIHCDANSKEAAITQEKIDETEKQLSLLRARSFLDMLTSEQAQQFFYGQLLLSELIQIRAAHDFATYLCKHPEELPKENENLGV